MIPCAPNADELDVVDVHGERVARLRTLHVQRSCKRIALIEIEVAQAVARAKLLVPESVRRLDDKGLPGSDGRAGLMLC
jgi:hypothetical protein